MKRNGGGREACLAEVFALIQIPPDIHSACSVGLNSAPSIQSKRDALVLLLL